jgi:5S rRNA maturation endonuclease (ribonuclease M5)/KaiC/GvpD/RAD55 family RecA-like ATPase
MPNGVVEQSKALAYCDEKGWLQSARKNEDHVILEYCPVCGKENYHFYMRYTPRDKDGLWDCKVCGQNGNLRQLREFLGDRLENTMSLKDAAQGNRQPGVLPDAEAAHWRLMHEAENENVDEVTLDYLIGTRGLAIETVERFKLGIINEYGKKWLVIPFYNNGNLIYAKYRTLPPEKKEFRGISGRECPLFNQEAIKPNMEELIFVEGEMDALSCLSNGIENVVGVPGANIHKAIWIKRLDESNPQKIYLLYDNDQVGQSAAREMAIRIGIDKCYNVVLPTSWTNGDVESPVKDINEFFKAGATLENLEVLKTLAKPFPVEGVQSVGEIIEDLRAELESGVGLHGKYDSPWPELNDLIGLLDEGDLVGIIAEGKIGKTTMAMNWLDHLVQRYKRAGLMFCQEMQPKRMVRKFIAYKTDTDDANITIETVDSALAAVADYEADYLFGYTKGTKFQEVADTIRQAVRRYGAKFVCFDNLQLLCRNIEHSAQETSVITKQFKQLAMELGIVILLIIQPNRVREGEIVAARNAHGSSAIEKDVDYMICLHRNREGKIKAEDFDAVPFMQVEENFQPQLLVRVDLSRYSSGGATTLWMIGAKSKVISFPEAARALTRGSIPANEKIEMVAA